MAALTRRIAMAYETLDRFYSDNFADMFRLEASA